jgi:hypothetical protein
VVKSGKVKIEISARYTLADAANCHTDLEGRKTTGSVIQLPLRARPVRTEKRRPRAAFFFRRARDRA